MMKKATKYGIMSIAAVLVIAMAFAGAASATPVPEVTVYDWSSLNANLTSGSATKIILGADIQMEGEITVGYDKTLDLNGFTLTAASGKVLFKVYIGKTFTLDDSVGGGKLVGNGTVSSYCGGVYVEQGTFTMNGGTITNCCGEANGGAISISSGAFTMNGGNITNCSTTGNYVFGGGVYLWAGTFIMNGGNITGCSAAKKGGGGVYVTGGIHEYQIGTFTMNGGNITGCSAKKDGGGVYVESSGTFNMYGGNITDCYSAEGKGGGVYGSFTMNGGNITDCRASENGGGVYVPTGKTFNMYGGCISGCNANNGSGVCIYYIYSQYQSEHRYGTFIMNGTACVAADNDVYLMGNTTVKSFFTNITVGTNGFTSASAGAKNITLQDGPAAWVDKIIVKNGVGKEAYFAVPSITGYTLKAGTGDKVSDLVLAQSAYVEVKNWDELKTFVEDWTSNEMRTIVVTQNLKNETGSAGDNYDGFEVKGNITIKPGATDVKIDANQKGRLFLVNNGGNLTLKGNGDATLTLKNGKQNGQYLDGGAIFVDRGGNLTLADGASITGSSTVNNGGGVYVNALGTFTMSGGNITGCSASQSGGGVFVSVQWADPNTFGTFNMAGGTISGCSAAYCGGGVYNYGYFTIFGGTITGCSANTGGGGGVYCANYNNNGAFNVTGTPTVSGNTLNGAANNVYLTSNTSLKLTGPFTGTIAIAYPAGVIDVPFGTYVSGSKEGAKNFISETPGYFGKVNSSANTLVWALINTTATPTAGIAEFSGTNTTTLVNNDKVAVVLLENVSNVGTSPVTFNASSPVTTPLPAVNGYTKDEEVAIFEITATPTGTSTINLTVTFKDAANATANKDKVRIFHYTAGTWQPLTSSILAEDGTKITYTAETNGFSPFGIGIYSAVPYTPSSSSSHSGGSVLLQPGQVAPTQAPTVAPTVKPTAAPTDKPVAPTVAPTANPTAQQTQASPAPVLGIIAGLGVAGLIYRLRK